MDELNALADAVRGARKRRRWGQQDLAEAAGVSLGVVSNLERRKTRPQPANEQAILRALGLEEPEPNYAEGQRDWPLDVSVVLDVIGLFLSQVPEAQRADVIHDLTRWIMAHPVRKRL